MSEITDILRYKIDEEGVAASVTPIYQCSAFSADSDYFYSRKNNPNVAEFEQVVAILEKSRHAIAYSCGMSAIYMVLDLLRPGDTLVINNLIYGCSYKLFQKLSEKRNIDLHILDLTTHTGIENIPKNTRMVFFETPTNPFLKNIDIKVISEKIKQTNPQALVVVDNTWATPLFQKPLKCGADISLHSCTKYFSGHSDVMGGVALTDNDDLHSILLQDRFYAGSIMTPYHAWLMRRSLQTFTIRINHQKETTKIMANFLKSIPQVKQVYYPNIDGKQLTDYGGILFFEFIDELHEQYTSFSKALTLFGTGTGMACVTSMVAQPYSGSHASMSDEEKEKMGIARNLVRLCFGLENVEDLKADLRNAFNRISENSSIISEDFINV